MTTVDITLDAVFTERLRQFLDRPKTPDYAGRLMLSWFRRSSRRISTGTLLAFLALTFSSAAPHPDDCHDADCAAAVPHDPSSHSIGRPAPAGDHPIHCVLCHWTRAGQPTSETEPLFAPAVDADIRACCETFLVLSQSPIAQPSLRAPPVSSRLA